MNNMMVGEEKVIENGLTSDSKSVNKYSCYQLGLRTLGLGLCLVAAVIIGLNKETETVAVRISQFFPTLHVPVTAKWYYLPSFVYFVAANAIACTYAATSIAISLMTKIKPHNIILLLLILDVFIVALLFSANGAVSFVGLIALKGNSHLHWHKVCGTYDNFCKRSGASLALSWFGSLVFLSLIVHSALNLHKKSTQKPKGVI